MCLWRLTAPSNPSHTHTAYLLRDDADNDGREESRDCGDGVGDAEEDAGEGRGDVDVVD